MKQNELDLVLRLAQTTRIPTGPLETLAVHQACYDWVYDFSESLRSELSKLERRQGTLSGVISQRTVVYLVPYGVTGNTSAAYKWYKLILPNLLEGFALQGCAEQGMRWNPDMSPKKHWLTQDHTLYELHLRNNSYWYVDIGMLQAILQRHGNINSLTIADLKDHFTPKDKIPKDWIRTKTVGVRSGMPNPSGP